MSNTSISGSFLAGRTFSVAERHDVKRILAKPSGDTSTDTLPPSVGERNSAAVVTEDKVRALRVAHAAGADLATLADAFGIHVRTARHIVQRTSWRHVQ